MKFFKWSREHRGTAAFLAFALFFTVTALWIFAPVLPLHIVTVSPDAPHSYSAWYAVEQWRDILCGKGSIYPDRIHQFLVSPFAWQELEYALPCFLAAIALCFYLRSRRVGYTAAYAGGLFFAFCGYSFTLVNAGHRGWFVLISYLFFSFGLLVKCFGTAGLWHFALLGAVLMWGGMEQPDIWLLFLPVVAAYALFLSFKRRKAENSWRFLRTVYPKFAISIAVMLAIGFASMRHTATDTVEQRKRQLDQSSATASGERDEAAKTREKWIFTTNWSMPPEDILEAVVPGVFGDESFRPNYPLAPRQHPYWGRLGRPYEFKAGRMMPNYRQHTLYVGILVFAFALTALFSRNKASADSAAAEKEKGGGADFSDVPFWGVVAAAALLLAFGRFTPVYRLIWMIPGVDLIRAPVKFYHIFELSICILAGYGVQALLERREAVALLRRIGFALFGTLGVTWLIAQISSASIASYVAGLGFGPQIGTESASYLSANLLRSLFIAALPATAGLLLAKKGIERKWTVAAVAVLVMAAVIDLAVVDRRYIIPIDVSADYRAFLLQGLREKTPEPGTAPVRWENLLSLVSGVAVLLWSAIGSFVDFKKERLNESR